MNTQKIIGLILLPFILSFTALAQTAEEIAEDYHRKAARECERLNTTLKRESTAIAAKLTAAGDLDGAAQISKQVKLKIDNLPLESPHGTIKTLFDQYDLAKKNILVPHKQDAARRLDAMLAKADGQDMESILRIGKAKASIQSDEPISDIPELSPRTFLSKYRIPKLWGYYTSSDYGVMYGKLTLNEDGTFNINAAAPATGVWKATEDPNILDLIIAPAGGHGEEITSLMIIKPGEALMKRYSGQRYLKAL